MLYVNNVSVDVSQNLVCVIMMLLNEMPLRGLPTQRCHFFSCMTSKSPAAQLIVIGLVNWNPPFQPSQIDVP